MRFLKSIDKVHIFTKIIGSSFIPKVIPLVQILAMTWGPGHVGMIVESLHGYIAN